MRASTVARVAVGAPCLAAPGVVLASLGGADRHDVATRLVARVLGCRLLAQAGVDLVLGRRTRGVDVVIELTHAGSMVPLAVRSPRHRRTATVSALVATGIAVLDLAGPAGRAA